MPARLLLPLDDLKEARKLLVANGDIHEIAKKFGVTPDYLYHAWKYRGLVFKYPIYGLDRQPRRHLVDTWFKRRPWLTDKEMALFLQEKGHRITASIVKKERSFIRIPGRNQRLVETIQQWVGDNPEGSLFDLEAFLKPWGCEWRAMARIYNRVTGE